MNARSLLCVAHQIAAERHGELLVELAQIADDLAEEYEAQESPKPLHELAHTLMDEALELLQGPRPNYGEAAAALEVAAHSDGRVSRLHRAVFNHFEDALRVAMARMIDLAEQEDETELQHRGAVN